MLDAWIVIEQLIDKLWTDHVEAIEDATRRRRLEDARTYTAAVRTEMLQHAAVIPADLCAAMHVAGSPPG